MSSFAAPLGLTVYFAGVLLYLFLIGVVLERRRLSRLGLPLLFLLVSLLFWYGCNFLSLLLRQMDLTRVSTLLGVVERIGFGTLAVLPGLLFHTHWRYLSDRFPTRRWERTLSRVLLSLFYASLLLLPTALRSLSSPGPRSPVERLEPFTLPFLSLLALSYLSTAWLCRRLIQASEKKTEKAVFSRLFVLFLAIPALNFLIFLAPALPGSPGGGVLLQLAFCSSLLPTLVVAHSIYRHGFLQIVLHRGLALVLFALVSLGLYLLGIRRLVLYLRDELSAPALLVEGVFVVAILLLLAPVSRWLDSYVQTAFRVAFKRYRDLAASLNRIDVIALEEPLLAELIEETLTHQLPARQVKISFPPADPPPAGARRLPLATGGRTLGYLDVVPGEDDFPALDLDALRVVGNEVASLLERSRLLRSKLETEKELERKSHLAQLGTMAASVAHNVKNPLSSMKTLLQLLGEAPNLTENQNADLEKVVEEIDRLSRTVSSLLQFSRPGEPGPSDFSEVELRRLVDSVAGVFEGDFKSKGLRLSTLIEPETLRVETDETRLREILGNLLSNALEASPRDGKIMISAASNGIDLVLSVEDQGQGVPEQHRQSIFLPFFSTKSRGTGLGLPIVQKRVEQLGGEVRLEPSLHSTGARFVVRIAPTSPSEKQGTPNARTHRR